MEVRAARGAPRDPTIDVLRGLTIAAVIAYHLHADTRGVALTPEPLQALLAVLVAHDWRGVVGEAARIVVAAPAYRLDLFLFVTGVVLARGPRRPVGQFWKRRARDVLPNYWLGSLGVALVLIGLAAFRAIALGTSFVDEVGSGTRLARAPYAFQASDLLRSLSVVGRFQETRTFQVVAPSMWYVMLLLQAYGVFPALRALRARTSAPAFLTGVLAFTALARWLVFRFDPLASFGPNPTVLYFIPFRLAPVALGMVSAGALARLPRAPATAPTYAGAVIAIAWVVVSFALATHANAPGTIAGVVGPVAPLALGIPAWLWLAVAVQLTPGLGRALAWAGRHSLSILLAQDALRLVVGTALRFDVPLERAFWPLSIPYLAASMLLARVWDPVAARFRDRIWPPSARDRTGAGSIHPAPSSRRARTARAIAALLLLAIGCFVAEAVLRLRPRRIAGRMDVSLDFDEALHTRVDDVRAYVPRPGAFHAPFYRINSLGIRDEETSRDEAAGTTRIVVLGDSVAFGYTVPASLTFDSQLEQLLADRVQPGHRIEVLNAGVAGYNTAQEAAFLETVIAPLAPDVVIVLVVANDTDTPMRLVREGDRFAAVSFAPEPLLVPAGPLGNWVETVGRHSRLARRALGAALPWAAAHGVVGSLRAVDPESDFPLAMRDIARCGAKIDARVVALLVPQLTNDSSELDRARSDAMRAAIEAAGIRCLDPRSLLVGLPADWIRAAPDDAIHPNPLGFHLLARFAAAELAALGWLPVVDPPPPLRPFLETHGRERIRYVCGPSLAPEPALDHAEQLLDAAAAGTDAAPLDLARVPAACQAQFPEPDPSARDEGADMIPSPPFTRRIYGLAGRFSRMSIGARVGAFNPSSTGNEPGDDANPDGGAVRFRILGDLHELWSTQVPPGGAAGPVLLDVSGVDALTLEADALDESSFGAAAGWVDARLSR